ncbi:hypothetical protein CPB84DRAFT_1218021 [Gymnopilus junonius]|uniref:Uncharacterized protein n=1 Tax=Gymnopilus junonius TaxID=109634 RepID=A0A9P5P0Q5_GYMJU|nr:hypothetical protein CPB84DRAFT_1218021 [Gymnopilus junonius]
MLPTSSSASGSSSFSSISDSSKAGMAALFLPGPVLSRNSTSTSTLTASSDDSDLSNVNSVIVGTQLRLDPNIQMTPIAVMGSSSPASSPLPPPSMLPVADGTAVRPRRCSIPEPPPPQALQPLQSDNNNPSCLPTPEIEEAEPHLRISSTMPQLASLSSISPLPSVSSTSTVSAPSAIVAISHSVSASNIPSDSTDNSKSTNTNESSLPALQSRYTGPPSPSFSDSYALAHPGEVEDKEIGLLPSLRSTINVSITSLHQAHSEPQHLSSATQTPPSALLIPVMNAPSSSSTSTQPEPPKLVVVNPTPNPTPHPTPPATPLLGGTIGPGGIIKSQWLTLPEGAVGPGARQHQLLQAAQKQIQQMQAILPQRSALRLPPPVAASGLPTLPAGPRTDMTLSAFDRSRSATMPPSGGLGLLDSGPRVTAHNAQHCTLESDVNVISDGGRTGYQANEISNSVVTDTERALSSSRRSSLISPKHAELSTTEARQDLGLLGSLEPLGSPSHSLSLQSSVERDEGRKHMGNRLSISSTTSSNHSQLSDITSTTNTTLLSSSEAELAEKMTAKALGSLSTVQSLSILAEREKEPLVDLSKDDGADNFVIVGGEDVDDEDAAPLSPLPPPGGLAMSPRSERRKKRNSAPAPATSSALLTLSPTSSTSGPGLGQRLSPKSSITAPQTHHASKTAGGGLIRRANSARSTSRSRSTGGSSVSRSRSREPGVGLGGFAMTSAGHAPPAVTTARKAPVISSGRGRPKVVVGRATASKARMALRRNSSGVNGGSAAAAATATADAEALEQENLRREKEEKEKTERMRAEALQKERHRSLESVEDQRRVEEERRKVALEREEREERLKREEAEMRRHQEVLEAQAGKAGASSSKRLMKFNIGSNSDQGSGVDSKSAESASDLSGGRRGAGRGGRGEPRHVEPPSQAKGKERQREMDQQEMAQQLERQLQLQLQQQQRPPPTVSHRHHSSRDQQNLQQHLQRQMSKQQLHQLQKMQQLHNQQHQHQPQQRQQQFQHHKEAQLLAQGQTSTSRQASTQQIYDGQVRAEGMVGEIRKAKGKEREVVVLSPKPTESSSKVNATLNDDLATKIKQSLAAPLLPQNKRTIVLATSESEFETDSEDDGTWSSEEMTGDETKEQRAREEQLQQQELQRQYQQQQQQQRQRQQQQLQQNLQQQQQPIRLQGVQRTQSSHYPAPNARAGGKQHRQSQSNTQAIMEKAALEVQRQRDMFVKLPTSSFQDLAKARTRSVGLLTQLMNPNPEIFPADHPYRRGFSSGEIRLGGGAPIAPARPVAPPAPQPARAADKQPQPTAVATRPTHHRRSTDIDDKRTSDGPSRSNFSPPGRALNLQRTKSAAAMPLSSQILASSVRAPPAVDMNSAMPTNAHSNGSSGDTGQGSSGRPGVGGG